MKARIFSLIFVVGVLVSSFSSVLLVTTSRTGKNPVRARADLIVLDQTFRARAQIIGEEAISPLLQLVVIAGFFAAVPLGLIVLMFYRLDVLQRREGLAPSALSARIKWWLLFLTFSEPEQHHGIIGLHEMGSVGSSVLTAAVWALGPLIVLAGILISSAISPSFIVVGTLLSVVAGVLVWLEFLHILYDRPPKKETFPTMTARYNTSLNIYMCPKCLFPLDGNGGTCKVCGAKVNPAEE